MPKSGSPLTSEELATLRDFILSGPKFAPPPSSLISKQSQRSDKPTNDIQLIANALPQLQPELIKHTTQQLKQYGIRLAVIEDNAFSATRVSRPTSINKQTQLVFCRLFHQ